MWCVVVAAGSGRRFGGAKQWAVLGGRSVVSRSVESARAGGCDGIVLVVPPEDQRNTTAAATNPDHLIAGAATRSGSVRAGLSAVPDDAGVIVVHDAARPLASPSLFESVIAAVEAGAEGAVPAITVRDTLKRVDGSWVTATVDREGIVAVQTPQAFRADVLRRAHAAGDDATDDAGVVEAAGGRVRVVEGDVRNIKITSPADLALAESLLR